MKALSLNRQMISVDEDSSQFLIIGERRTGKSMVLLYWLINCAAFDPESRALFVSNFSSGYFEQLLMSMSEYLMMPPIRYIQFRRLIAFSNGSTIRFVNEDSIPSIYGNVFHRAAFDEICSWKESVDAYQISASVRLGSRPQIGMATTPGPNMALLERVLLDPKTIVRVWVKEDSDAVSAKSMLDSQFG